MAKKKYYAVKNGKNPGIYQTWGECEEQVNGFSGARYKSFANLEEAEQYINADLSEITKQSTTSQTSDDLNQEIEKEIRELTKEKVIAFVDGSYNDEDQKIGYGAILITNEAEYTLYKALLNSPYVSSRNVTGEIEAVKDSVSWAIDHKKQDIKIFYDYEGIEKWATKEWKATKKLTQEYVSFLKEKTQLIKISFKHTKAHSGINYNERVDSLAKYSLLSHGYKTHNDGSIYFIGFDENDWTDMIESIKNENIEFEIEDDVNYQIFEPTEYKKRIDVSSNGDKVIINCYRGKKSYVQGKQSVLFQKLISFAIEKLPTEKAVIETLKSYHAVTLEEIKVENEFTRLLPDFPCVFGDDKHRNNLLSAVFNTMLTGYMPEYTFLVTPIFRATEFYLHRILSDKLGLETEGKNGNNNFAYFNKNPNTKIYEFNRNSASLNQGQINYLNDLYNYYNKIRHPYTHWSQNSTNTHVITEVETARDLLIKGLQKINNYYTIFN